MSSPALHIETSATLGECLEKMSLYRCSSLAVVEGDEVAGLVSYKDLLAVLPHAGDQGRSLSVRDYMTPNAITIDVGESLPHAANLMLKENIHRLYVLSNGVLTGVLSTRDLMFAVRDENIKRTIAEFMSGPVHTVPLDAKVSQGQQELVNLGVSALVVVDQQKWPVGLLTESKAATASAEQVVQEVMTQRFVLLPRYTEMGRAASQASQARAHHVIVLSKIEPAGILSGLDFARAVAASASGSE